MISKFKEIKDLYMNHWNDLSAGDQIIVMFYSTLAVLISISIIWLTVRNVKDIFELVY